VVLVESVRDTDDVGVELLEQADNAAKIMIAIVFFIFVLLIDYNII
jgi:hypothetical protein